MKPWSYVENVFLNVTNGTYQLMLIISTFHLNALKKFAGDPFFDGLIAAYEPFHTAFEKQYSAWKLSSGSQKSKTLTLGQLFELVTTKLDLWDPAIRIVCPKGSADYTILFPQGRSPFTKAKTDTRIMAFQTLATALKNYAALATVQTEVQTFYQQLTDARNIQEQEKTGVAGNSTDVENARVDCADQMYLDLASIMMHFYKQRDKIARFFDEKNIRNHQQLIFTHLVGAEKVHTVVKHTFSTGFQLTLNNTGIATLVFYLAQHEGLHPVAGAGITVAPGASTTITAEQLGLLTNTFLLVYNTDTVSDGEYEVDFL